MSEKTQINESDLFTYLEIARFSLRDRSGWIWSILDLSDEELDRLEEQLEEYMNG